MSAQLPPFWEARLDPASNYTYYFNTQTGVSQWEPPAEQANAGQNYGQARTTTNNSTGSQNMNQRSNQGYQGQQASQGYQNQSQKQTDDLEPGWEERHDPNSGYPYYFNPSTGVSQWEKPIRKTMGNANLQGSSANLNPKANMNANTNSNVNNNMNNPQKQAVQEPLPAGWNEVVDNSSGRTYFVNTQTGLSQWERPKNTNARAKQQQQQQAGKPTVSLQEYIPPLSSEMQKIYDAKQAQPTEESSHTYKFVVVGAGAVGKSALVVRFIKDDFVADYDPTIEDSYRRQFTVDGVECLLDILDTAGQEEYSALRDNYMRNGEGFLTVFAVNSRMTFSEIPDLVKQVLLVKDCDEIPVLIIGSKCDLNATVAQKDVNALCDQHHFPFYPCSALAGINVEYIFTELVRFCRKISVADRKKKTKCCVL